MLFGSTREGIFDRTAPEAVLSGIAPDGGLYVPDTIPLLYDAALPDEDYISLATRIFERMLPGYTKEECAGFADGAYRETFAVPNVTPLRKVGSNHVLELFHGPTCAFKDIALCALPLMMAAALRKSSPQRDILILTATSGDTGSAALSGFLHVPGVRIIVFYPEKGVSPVQKAQMVTQDGDNVSVCAIRGDFDDAQRGVKRIFADDAPFSVRLSSANSINIGRLVPQMTYYFMAYNQLIKQGGIKPGDKVSFSVPTGNFGDILAGYLAKRAGLPIARLICATNANDVLKDFLLTGIYNRRRTLKKTLSPSMDILVSSNLERLLFFESGGDAPFVRSCMRSLQSEGRYTVPDRIMNGIRQTFSAGSCGDAEALAVIRDVWQKNHYLIDPHTAAAWKVAQDTRREAEGHPHIVLATASPFKFPRAIGEALDLDVSDTPGAPGELGQKLRLAVPPPLQALAKRTVVHQDVVDVGDMSAYVFRKAALSKW